MAQAVQLFNGVVKFPAGKVFSTQYGDRTNAVITLDDGSEAKLWGSPTDATLLQLKRGDKVQLAKDAKGFKLVSSATPNTSSNGHKVNWAGWTDEEKRAIAAKIQQQAKLYRYCFQTAQEQMGEFCQSEESLRAIATTLFLQALK